MTPPESKVRLELIRDEKTKKISVTIGKQPGNMAPMQPSTKSQTTTLGDFGLSLQELTPELAEQFEYNPNQGVLITAVEPDSPAGRIGLQAGQLIEEVNRQQVGSLSELKKVLSSAKNKQQVLLRIRAGKSSQYIVLRNE